MYGLMFFLHIAGLCIWFGSMVTVLALLLVLRKELRNETVSALTQKTIRISNRITHPSAFLVLLSGIVMLVMIGMDQHSNLPFWIIFMEQAGSLVILAFFIAVSIAGRKVTKHLAANNLSLADKSLNTYLIIMVILALAIIAVIYVVSAKIL